MSDRKTGKLTSGGTMKKISCILAVLLLFTTACQFNKQFIADKKSENIPSAYHGVYKGTLPCADCPGIESKLVLNKDRTCTYENNYMASSNGHVTYTGTYTVKDNLLTLQTNTTPIYFLARGQELLLLDDERQPAQGPLAPYYTLKKQGDNP